MITEKGEVWIKRTQGEIYSIDQKTNVCFENFFKKKCFNILSIVQTIFSFSLTFKLLDGRKEWEGRLVGIQGMGMGKQWESKVWECKECENEDGKIFIINMSQQFYCHSLLCIITIYQTRLSVRFALIFYLNYEPFLFVYIVKQKQKNADFIRKKS